MRVNIEVKPIENSLVEIHVNDVTLILTQEEFSNLVFELNVATVEMSHSHA